ncbi:hypothetical protein QW131_15235 [Roseibium salinum]|nr:hypothetical protein [Roseibium salinum]
MKTPRTLELARFFSVVHDLRRGCAHTFAVFEPDFQSEIVILKGRLDRSVLILDAGADLIRVLTHVSYEFFFGHADQVFLPL